MSAEQFITEVTKELEAVFKVIKYSDEVKRRALNIVRHDAHNWVGAMSFREAADMALELAQ
jgi:hypothetical protein